jgi:hypothetical protein
MGAVVHNIGSVFVVLIAASLAFTPDKSRREKLAARQSRENPDWTMV